MSFTFQRNDDNTNSMRCSRLIHGQMQRMSVHDSPENRIEDRLSEEERDDDDDDDDDGLGYCSSGSSSIGRNSDASGESSSEGEDSTEEADVVQNSPPKEPLDTMDALADSLPVRKGISNYYEGRSKSFTSLADAVVAPSVKDFAKPDNPYNRRRKNLANNPLFAKNRNRSMMALSSASSTSDFSLISTSPSTSRPPLHPQVKKPTAVVKPSPPTTQQPNPPCRSFSLSDLQFVAASTPSIGGLVVHRANKDIKPR